jgi:hypothetical protein
VHEAAVGGGHRFERDWVAVLFHAIRHTQRLFDDLLFAAVAVMLGIDGDATLAGVTLAEHEVDEVLEIQQRLSAAPDENTKVVAAYVNHRQGRALPITRRHRLAKADFRVDFKDTEEVIDDAGGEVHLFGIDIRFDDRLVLVVAATFAWWALRAWASARPALSGSSGPRLGTSTAGPRTATAEEVGFGERGAGRFHEAIAARGPAPTSGAGAAATFAPLSAAGIAPAGLAWRTFFAGGGTITAAASATTATATASTVIFRSLPGEPLDADAGVAGATAKETAFLALIEHGHFDLFASRPECGECRPKSVVDGFAACFGLVHLLSSIPVRSRLRRRRNRNAYRGPRVGALLLLGTGRVAWKP